MTVTGPAAYGEWNALAERSIDDFDPRWIPHLPSKLLSAARKSVLGRRILAGELARGPGRHLYSPVSIASVSDAPEQRWIFWPAQRLRFALADVGAMALRPALRMLVQRRVVGMIREGIGDERYQWVMHEHADTPAHASRARLASAGALLTAHLAQPDKLRRQFERCGAHELAAATQGYPLGTDRLRLVCAPSWLEASSTPALSRESTFAALYAREPASDPPRESRA